MLTNLGDRSEANWTLQSIVNLRMKIKKIVNKIEEPFRKVNHRTVKEAIDDILTKMKEEFPQESFDTAMAKLFGKSSEEDKKTRPRFMSRSLTFDHLDKKRGQSLGPNHWAAIMQSTREISSGITQFLEIKFNPILSKGQPSLIILVRDVTEKEIIKQMEEKERGQTKALASVSHEFRTPLNGILGMLDGLKEVISEEYNNKFVTPATNSAKLLLALVNDILDFHQIKEKKLVLVPTKFKLKPKIEECCSLIASQAKNKGIKVEYEIDKEVPKKVFSDSNRLQQVLINLLGNSLKFTTRGSINVKVEPYPKLNPNNEISTDSVDIMISSPNPSKAKKLMISVSDTGIGIAPEDVQKLFKVFGKIDSKKNRQLNPQGVGLGLNISNMLAKFLCQDPKLSGLNVSSELGKGSKFWFIIDNPKFTDDESYDLDDEEDDNNQPQIRMKELNQTIDVPNANNSVFFTTSQTFVKDSISPLFPLNNSGKGKKQHSLDLVKREISSEESVKPRSEARHKSAFSSSKTNVVVLEALIEKIKEKNNSPLNILITDDNDINHIVFKNFLSAFDLNIESAYNGQQALDKIIDKTNHDNENYSIIFLDIEMPVMDGKECTKEIKRLIEEGVIQKTPIVAQSAHSDKGEISKIKKFGMDEYLMKPFKKDELINLVIQLLKLKVQQEFNSVNI